MTLTTEQILLIIAAVGVVAVNIINAWRQSAKMAVIGEKTDAVMDKVDGNFSDLKVEVAAAKAETVLANQRIAVLTERLITSTPMNGTPPSIVINGTAPKREPPE